MPFRPIRKIKNAAAKREQRAAVRKRKEAKRYTHPHSGIDLVDRTNVTITDESRGVTILQKIGPTSQHNAQRQKMSSKDGFKHMHALFDIVDNFPEASDQDGEHVCHLGMSTYGQKVEWSTDHKQSRPASDDMLAWILSYFDANVYSQHGIRDNSAFRKLLADDFKADLKRRAARHETMQGEERVDPMHKWWNRATVIVDSRTDFHTDDRYEEPSILINFGSTILFEVDGSKVCLYPGDVLLYRANLPHRFRTLEGSIDGEMPDRFALCLRTRKVLNANEVSTVRLKQEVD